MASAQPVRQTSVRVPRQALEALDRAAITAGKSRDAMIRDLLVTYVEVQRACEPDERLTHLTTVLRLPRLPPGRNREDPRSHLRLRMPDELKAAATEHGFVLPGQSSRHGHHDYAGRPLTDSVMTAIELVQPIALRELGDLPRLLPRRTAMGLWRLTVAATLTPAERRALWGGGVPDLVPVLTEEDIAWHHPWRFEVAEHLLRRIYHQPDADVAENVQMLHDQTEAFTDLLGAMRRGDFSTAWLTEGLPCRPTSVDGRGGAAVWRGQRKLTLEALGKWATTPKRRRDVSVHPPGWALALPPHWRIRAFNRLEPVPAPLMAEAATGRVALLTWRSRVAIWPLDVHGEPIAGFDAVIRGGRRLAPERLLETVLHQLDYPHVYVPAEAAHKLGFIGERERDDLLTNATAVNEARIKTTLRTAKRELDQDEYLELAGLASDPELFERFARRRFLRFRARRAHWVWDVGSVPQALMEGHTADRLEYLTRAIGSITTRILEQDMEHAAQRAFYLGTTPPNERDL